MKKQLLLFGVVVFTFNSCIQTRYITERIIKNSIETHTPGEFSTIRTFSIYKLTDTDKRYIEFTGYKYKDKKGKVIGGDRTYRVQKNFKEDNTRIVESDYVHLTENQCAEMLNNYRILQEKISREKKSKMNEEIYYDFTVSDDCFISVRKYTTASTYYTNIWLKGEKYRVVGTDMVKSLEKFLKY